MGVVPRPEYDHVTDPQTRVVTAAVVVGFLALLGGGWGVAVAEDGLTGLVSLLLVPTGVVLWLVATALKLDFGFVWWFALCSFALAGLCGTVILAGHAFGGARTFETGVLSGLTMPLGLLFASLAGLADLFISREALSSQSRDEREQMVENGRRRF